MEAYPGYLGLLKWSLAQSDGTSTPSASRMTEDDKAWLKEAFEALTVDEAKRMKELLAVLREEDCEERVEDKEAAFDELVFYGESIDNARGAWRCVRALVCARSVLLARYPMRTLLFIADMCTLGGLHAVGPMLASQFPALRAAAANLVAVICQNNPKVQTSCLLARFMPVLMHMTANDPEVSVRLKALLGLSCTCCRLWCRAVVLSLSCDRALPYRPGPRPC